MSVARPVRLARAPRPTTPDSGAPPSPAAAPTESPPLRRENVAATQRAVRLSLLFAAAVAAVYAVLFAFSFTGPAGGSTGTTEELWIVGFLALAVVGLMGVVSLGSAPRAVELGDDSTVVIGRFGHRYRFPGRDQLKVVVLQRITPGLLTPGAIESVEIQGGSSRRSFLVDEGLLRPARGDEGPPS